MDRHNMMLFLQNDTQKYNPAGFELPRRNIFDPDEDQVYVPLRLGSNTTKPAESLANGTTHANKNCTKQVVDHVASTTTVDTKDKGQESLVEGNGTKEAASSSPEKKRHSSSIIASNNEGSKLEGYSVCARPDCDQKARFDSIFCSDSCGVSTLETDLLRTLQYANKLHPSLLRTSIQGQCIAILQHSIWRNRIREKN